MEVRLSVLILAGGESSRIGYPKAYLKSGDKNLVQKIIDTYRELSPHIYVTMNHDFTVGAWQNDFDQLSRTAKVIINDHPEKGRFYSISLGLKAIGDADFAFIHHVDNPVTANVIKKLWSAQNPEGYTVPSYEKKNGHPILISRKIISDAISETDKSKNWKDFLSVYPKKIVEVDDPSVLINLNTLEDYKNYFQVHG